MNMQKKTILFFSVCIIVVSFLVAFIAYRNAVSGFEESLKDQVNDEGVLFSDLIEGSYPGEWTIKGDSLYKGNVQVNGKTSFIDDLSQRTGSAFTIFLGDTRVTTTVKNEKGERAVGTKASAEIADRVLKNGETVVTEAQVVGKLHFVSYQPIKDASGKNIGMLFVGVPADTLDGLAGEFIVNQAIAMVIILIVMGVLVTAAVRKQLSPLTQVQDNLQAVAEGNLSIPDLQVCGNDEIAHLAHDTNQMKEAIRRIMEKISNSAEQVSAASEELTASALQTAESIRLVAESAVKMAENNHGQVEKLNVTNDKTNDMSSDMSELTDCSNLMKKAAEESMDGIKSGQVTVRRAIDTMSSMSGKINESAAIVEELGERSANIVQVIETISNIASQTNLLSLNAAIEAARAGEAGRGFAVVAEEVRKLAEQSETATQSISDMIMSIKDDTAKAVKAMQENNEGVKEGTKIVTEAGEAFEHIAELIDNMYRQIGTSLVAIEKAGNACNEINGIMNEVVELGDRSSEEAQGVSASTEEQAAMMDEISKAAHALSSLAGSLQAEVSKFKI